MKKLFKFAAVSVFGLAMLVGTSFTTAKPVEAAVTPGWQWIMHHGLVPHTSGGAWTSYFNGTNEVMKSSGGQVKVDITKTPLPVLVKLYEQDEEGNPDEFIGGAYMSTNDVVYFDVEKFVDGTNNKAEIYASYGATKGFPNSDKILISYWD